MIFVAAKVRQGNFAAERSDYVNALSAIKFLVFA